MEKIKLYVTKCFYPLFKDEPSTDLIIKGPSKNAEGKDVFYCGWINWFNDLKDKNRVIDAKIKLSNYFISIIIKFINDFPGRDFEIKFNQEDSISGSIVQTNDSYKSYGYDNLPLNDDDKMIFREVYYKMKIEK
jgi:hypothetical protein